MTSSQLQDRINSSVDFWLDSLDNYSMEELLAKPADDVWSVGQVYIHLWMSAKGFFFKNVVRITTNERTTTGSKNLPGWIVFTFGKFPAVKVKMPDSVAVQPNQPESKEQIVRKMNEVKTLAAQYIAQLPSLDPKLRTKHPFLGHLSAAEWIRLCELHCNHHRAQLKRIDKALGRNK
jgi:uncharacterized damage-inducible protein DinB